MTKWSGSGTGTARRGHSSGVVAIAFSPDRKLVAYGPYGSTVRLWGSASGAVCITIWSYRALVMVRKFLPDGKLVAFECETRMVGPWDPANGTGQCTAIAFSPNSKLLVSASKDKTVRIWEDWDC
jgi:WD40 repeat protein